MATATVSEEGGRPPASVGVTRDFWNNQVFLWGGKDGEPLYRCAPRWITVVVLEKDGKLLVHSPDYQLEGWTVRLKACVSCGADYLYRVLDAEGSECRVCYKTRRAVRQRRYRAARRELGLRCEQCGGPLAARRSSRRYCSDTCRVKAFRERKARAVS